MTSQREPTDRFVTRIWAQSARLDLTGVQHLYGFVDPRTWNGVTWWEPEFNVVVIHSPNAGFVVIASVDALYANEIYAQVSESLRESDLTLMLGASHSHYTPSYAGEFPVFAHDAGAHVKRAADRLRALIFTGVDELNSCDGHRGSYREARSTHTVSRRRRTGLTRRSEKVPLAWGRVMQPTDRRPIDAEVVAWELSGAATPVVMWTFPCHPTGFFDHKAWTSEFPGAVRQRLRNTYGDDCVVLFLQGPSGDLRQPFTTNDPRRIGLSSWLMNLNPKALPSFCRPTANEWNEWADKLGQQIVSSLEVSNTVKPLALRRSRRTSIDSARLVTDVHPVDELTLDLIPLADDVTLAMTNAEITSQLAIDARLPPTTHLMTCVNQCFGYLASDQEVSEGGYESCTWLRHFGCAGAIEPGSPDIFIDALQRLDARSREGD